MRAGADILGVAAWAHPQYHGNCGKHCQRNIDPQGNACRRGQWGLAEVAAVALVALEPLVPVAKRQQQREAEAAAQVVGNLQLALFVPQARRFGSRIPASCRSS
mmetsp:Transcript_13225/g.28946  ORF Transcript_13225/g.28946 Transcript_13225/m.28946 type:complete len:104 (+) Transcript_13225:533-844(+)